MNPYLGGFLAVISMWISGYTFNWFQLKRAQKAQDYVVYGVVAVATGLIGVLVILDSVGAVK